MMHVLLYLFLFGLAVGNEESEAPSFSITRYQCSTSAFLDADPDRASRIGHIWLDEDCEPSLFAGQCMMGVRKMSPYFEGAWLHDDTQMWDREIQYGDIFYPGGPGFGTVVPGWNINGAYYLDDSDGRQRSDFDTTVDILCTQFDSNDGESSSESSSDDIDDDESSGVYRTNCVSSGTIDISETDPFIPFMFLESECDNGLPNGDCIGFNKLSSNCGHDCDRVFLGPNDVTSFNNGPGLLLTNVLSDPGGCPPGFYGFKTDYLCADWDKLDLQHTICTLKENSNDKYVSYGDETVFSDGVASTRAWYQWEEDDCTDGLPQGECIALLKGTTYCCNYSFNFKSIQDQETVGGVEGPGITFEVSTIDECDALLNDLHDGSFWLSVDYLCGINVGDTISDQDD